MKRNATDPKRQVHTSCTIFWFYFCDIISQFIPKFELNTDYPLNLKLVRNTQQAVHTDEYEIKLVSNLQHKVSVNTTEHTQTHTDLCINMTVIMSQ